LRAGLFYTGKGLKEDIYWPFFQRDEQSMLDPSHSIKLLDDLLTRNKGRKRILLLEIRKNISTVEYLDNNVPIDTVIEKLESDQLKKALESNFDFRSYSILRHKVNKKTARKNPFYERYVGWTTEELFNSIYLKIDSLKTIASINPEPKHVDKKARLMNIYRLMNLLLLHLNKKRTRDSD
jgi:hypothetical protein